CAELAPLGPHLAEVRSLAVDRSARHAGVGAMLVDQLQQRACRDGFEKLCAFTHTPAYFIRMGFSIVPHLWLPEKIFSDCVGCPLFRRCGKYAMIMSLEQGLERSLQCAPNASLEPAFEATRGGASISVQPA